MSGALQARDCHAVATPLLALVPPPDPLAPPRTRRGRLSRRWWRLRGQLEDVRWRVIAAVLNPVAPARLREQAYRDGFALALGVRDGHFWTGHLHEYTDGNEDGIHSRYAVDPFHLRPRPCLVQFAPPLEDS